MKLLSMYNRTETHLPEDVYVSISDFIISKLVENEEISFHTLLDEALQSKSLKFEGNLGWCLLRVKHDLEARGVIQIKMKAGTERSQIIKLKRKRRSIL
ncbi:MAG: hypothetical protein ABI663_14140 [Chryseolinea sp.]